MNSNKSDRVTIRDVYEVVTQFVDKQDKRIEFLENKVDKVEAVQNKTLGTLTILTTAVTSAVTIAINYLFKQSST